MAYASPTQTSIRGYAVEFRGTNLTVGDMDGVWLHLNVMQNGSTGA